MATQRRRRRGTTAQHATFTGAGAELTVDTDKNTVVVHDGATPGGFPLAKESALAAAFNSANTTYDNATSGAAATKVQGAIDEVFENFVGYLRGMEIANDLTDAANDILVRSGFCRDSTGAGNIAIAAPLIKRLYAAFAAGDGNGMRSSASLADGTWHIFAIGGAAVDGDVLAHNTTDPSAVLPSGYTLFRHIASIIRTAGVIVKFFQDGDYFTLDVPAVTNVAANPGTSAVAVALAVPTGLQVVADIAAEVYTTSAHAGATTMALITSMEQTDTAPESLIFDLRASAGSSSSSRNVSQIAKRVKTNTDGQVRFRISASDAGISGSIVARGWWLNRGRS